MIRVNWAKSDADQICTLQTSTANSQKHPPVQGCPQNWLGNVQSCRNKEGFEWREFTANSGSLPSSLVMKYNQRYAPEVLIADWLGRPLHLHRACPLDASGTTTLSRMLSTREILLVTLGCVVNSTRKQRRTANKKKVTVLLQNVYKNN
ncbi:hypothetical protein ACTXT7_003753 [Hymenolepis weldensis]